MKLLVVTASYPPHEVGGYEIRCKDVVDGLPELVSDKENGYLVKPQNIYELAYAIEYLINNPGLRIEMGRRSRSIVERKFNLENEVSNWLQYYLMIVN